MVSCQCPSFFLCFIRRRRVLSVFYLSLSFRGAGETQIFLVWVSPCVFVATISYFNPYFEDDTYIKVPTRLFFFFAVVVRHFGGGWSWFVGPLSLSLSLLVVVLVDTIEREGVAYNLITAPPIMMNSIACRGVEHDAVSRTVRPEPLVLPTPPPAVP